jgi:hypothetical protein
MAKYMQSMGYGDDPFGDGGGELAGMDEEALSSYMGKPLEELSY